MPNKGRWERARCPSCKRTISCSRSPWDRGGPERLKLRRHKATATHAITGAALSVWCPVRFASMAALLPYRLTEGRR